MQNNNSLPIGFDKLKTEKPYINLGKLAEGEHRFRIVQRPIAGWIDWKDRKPYRFKPEEKPRAPFDATKPIRPFWAVHVWDYAREGLFVMEITQNSIRRSLEMLALNEDWGDLTTFDFKIKKEGSGIETNYSVIPIPPKPLSSAVKEALTITKIRLEALYEGKDPWNDLEEMMIDTETGEVKTTELTKDQKSRLDLCVELAGTKVAQNVMRNLGIKSIHEVPISEFDRTIKYFENVIKSKERANEPAAVA